MFNFRASILEQATKYRRLRNLKPTIYWNLYENTDQVTWKFCVCSAFANYIRDLIILNPYRDLFYDYRSISPLIAFTHLTSYDMYYHC